MNEKLQYAQMLEIPENTVSISFRPPKKRKLKRKDKKTEEVKEVLIEKINGDEPDGQIGDGVTQVIEEKIRQDVPEEIVSDNSYSEVTVIKKGKVRRTEGKKKGFNIIALEFVLIGLLLATIIVTNALVPGSGLNTLFASVFGNGNKPQAEDARVYSDFNAVAPVKNTDCIILENGVMTFSDSGSIYSPCDGKVISCVRGEDGKFTVEIEHNGKFKTVIKGLDFAYCEEDAKVFNNLPVGYIGADKGAQMCLYGENGAVITGYTLSDGALVWAE